MGAPYRLMPSGYGDSVNPVGQQRAAKAFTATAAPVSAWLCHRRSGRLRSAHALFFGEANEREMPERRHRAAFEQVNIPCPGRPTLVALEGEVRSPAELTRRRREPMLQRPAKTCLSTDTADQHDFSTRF